MQTIIQVAGLLGIEELKYINNEINNKLLNRGIESLEQAFEPIKSGINKLISEYKTTTSRKIQKMKSEIDFFEQIDIKKSKYEDNLVQVSVFVPVK